MYTPKISLLGFAFPLEVCYTGVTSLILPSPGGNGPVGAGVSAGPLSQKRRCRVQGAGNCAKVSSGGTKAAQAILCAAVPRRHRRPPAPSMALRREFYKEMRNYP